MTLRSVSPAQTTPQASGSCFQLQAQSKHCKNELIICPSKMFFSTHAHVGTPICSPTPKAETWQSSLILFSLLPFTANQLAINSRFYLLKISLICSLLSFLTLVPLTTCMIFANLIPLSLSYLRKTEITPFSFLCFFFKKNAHENCTSLWAQ